MATKVIEQIGRGGMATVYKANQPSLDRYVALKNLPPYYAQQDKSFLERFKREAHVVAKLRHPNILMVMDFGQEEDISYIVMDYVSAGTLKERMQQPLNLSEISTFISQIGSALDYAHTEGVVHRDVKPSNVLLPKPDWALLTDFGLAHMVGGSMLTQSGLSVGTPAYMAPEQGSGDTVDARSDVYSLGIMLYEMTTGEVPYTADTPMAVMVKHIVEPLPVPSQRNPNLLEGLEHIVLKSLAKNAAGRYQSTGELAAALASVADQHPDWSTAAQPTLASVVKT
ncbi:MAG: serine/threonine protein kinase [Chloroflexi bacterium]|nr:serine/threonine protein kinase [Chloroflexota bacterium]